jgi:hypothetical protein
MAARECLGLAIVETADLRSHRGDPPVFAAHAALTVQSVDVEDGLAADAALQEIVERSGRLTP